MASAYACPNRQLSRASSAVDVDFASIAPKAAFRSAGENGNAPWPIKFSFNFPRSGRISSKATSMPSAEVPLMMPATVIGRKGRSFDVKRDAAFPDKNGSLSLQPSLYGFSSHRLTHRFTRPTSRLAQKSLRSSIQSIENTMVYFGESSTKIGTGLRYPGRLALLVVWTIVGFLAFARQLPSRAAMQSFTHLLVEYAGWLTCYYPWVL